MKIEEAMKWIRIAFAFLFGAGMMSYAAYAWHIEWINDWQAFLIGMAGSAFTFAPHLVIKFIPKLFDATIGKFFGGKAGVILLLLTSTISSAQINTSKLRITTTPTNDNTLTQVLVRDAAASGEVKYRDASSLLMSIGAINGGTESVDGASISGSTIYMQEADASFPGIVSTGAQTFAGAKTFTGLSAFTATGTFNTTYQLSLGTGNLKFSENASGGEIQSFAGLPLYINSLGNNVIFGTGGTVNVGIGTTTPYAPLSFANVTGRKIMLYGSDNDHQFFGFGLDAPNDLLQHRISTTIGAHVFYAATSSTTSNELMRIAGNGDVGIGIGGAPTYRLDVSGPTAPKIRILTSAATETGLVIERTVNTPSRWEMYVPTGNTSMYFYNAANLFQFSTAGIGTATDWVATSDRRLKENIIDAGSQLVKVKSIASLTRNYDLKASGKNETGFIAQELFEIAPEYVEKPNNDSTMWAVNYSKMVVPLYKAVAELTAEVERLKKELNELKK